MGVHGLWRLIEPSGKPVPLETLENKVLAVDVSIWLHQAIKGYQDSRGQPVPNAHLLSIYHRICKLLYFKIRPVFVFDGGVPALKKETIAKRNQTKSKNHQQANKIQKQLLHTLLKHHAVSKVIAEKAKISLEASTSSGTKENDLYDLPTSLESSVSSSSDEEADSDTETTTDSSPTKHWDIHSIDMESTHFKSLPADVRHDILTEMKETRKQSSWGRLHELPTQSDDFAVFQLNRLRKRHKVQVCLEEAEQEMGGHSLSLGELEKLLNDHGIITNSKTIGNRIASDENTRYLLIKDIKAAIEEAKKKEQQSLETVKEDTSHLCSANKAELEYESDLKQAIELSLQSVTSKETSGQKEEVTVIHPPNKEHESKHLDLLSTNITKGVPESSQPGSDIEHEEKRISSNSSKDELESCLFTAEKGEAIPENTDSLSEETDRHFEEDLQTAIKLSLESAGCSAADNLSFLKYNDSFIKSDSDADDYESDTATILASAKNYMIEYSGLTPNEIAKIITKTTTETQSNNLCSHTKQKDTDVQSELFKTMQNVEPTSTNIVETAKPAASDSDSSDEFVEVPDDTSIEKVTNKLGDTNFEVIVNPGENLEDDLFVDIFSEEKVKNDTGFSPDIKTKEAAPEEKSKYNIEKTDPVSEKHKQRSTDDSIKHSPLTIQELEVIKESLAHEKQELITERSTRERLACNITDQMCLEAQELLRLFGIPYVIAPMEAEAQCAFLDEINLTDGTITDDSDIWLFGGKTVYKNFFNHSKHVLEFKAENIQHLFKLNREQMILLALLVGSDYTTGIQGVGPVTALEILAAFPYPKLAAEFTLSHQQLLSGLHEFRKWWNGTKKAGPSRTSLRNKLRNIILAETFPSLQVLQAYLKPTVETSREAFSWAKPDLIGLIDFARDKFGWSKSKSEEILTPIMKKLQEKNVQTTIRDYFKTKYKIDSGEFENQMSKRVKRALDKLGLDEGDVEEKEDIPKQPRRQKGSSNNTENKAMAEKPARRKRQKLPLDEDIEVLKKTRAISKKKVEEIKRSAMDQLKVGKESERVEARHFHKKEVIPQKQMDQIQLIRRKMKAIEAFRKSKQGPGYVKKRGKVVRHLKEDADLSESSSSE